MPTYSESFLKERIIIIIKFFAIFNNVHYMMNWNVVCMFHRDLEVFLTSWFFRYLMFLS